MLLCQDTSLAEEIALVCYNRGNLIDLFNSSLFCIQELIFIDYYDKQLYWSVPILLRFPPFSLLD
jgi:hypothetical protein